MKKRLFLLAAILAMASSTPAWAYDFSAVAPSGQTLYYNIVSGSAQVTYQNPPYSSSPRYSNLTGALTIPSSVTDYGTTYTVTSIGSSAFDDCTGLTSVTIPSSVTSIGDGAFRYCYGLTSVTIPSSVTSIGNYAFYNVRHIEYYGSATGSPWGAISMNGITEGDFVFSDATKHVLLAYIGAGGSVVIPSTVETIGTKAFYGCTGLTSVTIPNSVTSIGNYAFYNCTGLTSTIYTGTIAQWCGISFGYGSANPLNRSHSLTIGGSEVTNLVIPNGVTEIKQCAFEGCTGLTSVTIPNSVTSIGSGAFAGCSGLTSVTIPNSVTSIGSFAFSGCTGLTSVTIPNSVTSIGSSAFSGCTGLTSVTIPNNVTSIGSSAFSGCTSLTSTIYTGTIAQWCNISFDNYSANPVFYSHSLTIGGTEITNLVIPNGVTEIKQYAFYNCSSLISVTIPSSVTSIGVEAFYNCTGLTSITIPNSVTSIGSSAFSNVRHIEYYGIATGSPWGAISMNGITEGDFVYSDATKHVLLAYSGAGGSVVIPSTVETIGTKAFYGCSGLTSVIIPNSVTSIGVEAFSCCSGITSVTIGSGVTTIGGHAFYSCTSLTSVTIPNSVTSIGGYAFRYCSGLTSFTIGSGVTSIGVCALGDCTGLRNIISKAVYPPTTYDYTFENAPSCKLTVPCGSLQYYQENPLWNTQFPLMEEDCNPDGIDDTEIGDVMAYAANGMIYISSTLPTETTIFDITGHKVATFTAEAASIPLPAGVYLVKIGAYPARKVVVIR